METIQQWGKVRRTDGGDTMRAVDFATVAEDRREATFIRVRKCSLFLPPVHGHLLFSMRCSWTKTLEGVNNGLSLN
jgi:hypothetical protein